MNRRILTVVALVAAAACSRQSPDEAAPSTPEVETAVVETPQPETRRAPAVVEAEPPTVAGVRVTPDQPVHGSRIQAAVSSPESDTLYEYIWYVDGERVAGEYGEVLSPEYVRKGRRILVEVVPSRGGVAGASSRSAELTVGNTPPEITGVGVVAAEPMLIMQVEARDVDGDSLRYRFSEAPQGMNIDAASGRISWQIPASQTGPVTYGVIVSDGEQEFFYGQTFTVQDEAAAR